MVILVYHQLMVLLIQHLYLDVGLLVVEVEMVRHPDGEQAVVSEVARAAQLRQLQQVMRDLLTLVVEEVVDLLQVVPVDLEL
jgi:hypothetical protein